MIRVRFAPSPTGYLHIGGVRTALFNYLYARSQQGIFVVRIEDTDRERFKPEFETEILESLEWLGLGSDEKIIRQSERLSRYREAAQELLTKGLAYEETLEGKTALRFKMPASSESDRAKTIFHDVVRGAVEFDASLFDDLVIIKSDGFPTYHWACVVDDHDMEITHVIRGEDHLSNTPRQILMYEAMGWSPPKYAHLPLILGDDGAPLSKRHGAVALSTFRKEGFLPDALLNYLALLGWGVQGGQEFFTLDELIKKFSLKRVNKSGAKFDREKFEWLNGQHLKSLPEEEYVRQMTESLKEESIQFDPAAWKKLVLLYRTRIKRYPDLREQAAYCFKEIESYDEEVRAEFLKNESTKKNLEKWMERAAAFEAFAEDAKLEAMTREVADSLSIQAKDLIHPLRFAVSGEKVTPGLFELMGILGKERCLTRIRHFLS